MIEFLRRNRFVLLVVVMFFYDLWQLLKARSLAEEMRVETQRHLRRDNPGWYR